MDRTKRLLALYLSSIIIGAGILALPLKAARIGLIPMIILTIFFGYFFYEAYKRIIEASIGIEGHIDLSTYDKVLERASLGKAARISLEYGMILYIVPADVVYTLFSASRYVKLSELSRDSRGFLLYFILSAIIGYLIAIAMMRHEKASKFFALLATRSLSVLILYALKLSYRAALALGSVLFMLTMLVGEYFPEYFVGEPEEITIKEGEIHPRHYVAAIYTIFKILFVLGIAFFSFLVVLYYRALPKDILYSSRDSIVILSGIGVTAFAFVGTGVYNIVMYDRLRRGDKRRGILALGTLIPAFLYLTFTGLMVFSVDRSLLIEADRSMEPSLLALAEKLESLGISISTGLLIGLAGIFTLLAVSMSYLGFTDTLGGRMERYLGRYSLSRFLSSLSATIIALIIVLLSPELSATGVLDIAGSSGGILFLLFLPFLFLRKRRDLIYALTALSLIFLANLPAIIAGSLIERLTALISSSIALALGILTLLEYRGERFLS